MVREIDVSSFSTTRTAAAAGPAAIDLGVEEEEEREKKKEKKKKKILIGPPRLLRAKDLFPATAQSGAVYIATRPDPFFPVFAPRPFFIFIFSVTVFIMTQHPRHTKKK